ncbi:MAG: hypothetical protein ACTSYI_09660 [Promethearchaeota archaeon]
MGSGLIFFNPFYQLLLIVLFSGLRIIRHILRSFILPTDADRVVRIKKNVGYWSSYYIMFGVGSIYNFFLLLTHPLYLTKSLHFFWVALGITLLAGLRFVLLAFFQNPSQFSRGLHLTVIIWEIFVIFVLIPSLGVYWGVLLIFLPMVLWPIKLIPKHSITQTVESPHRFLTPLGNIYFDVGFWFLALVEVILQYFGFSLGFW